MYRRQEAPQETPADTTEAAPAGPLRYRERVALAKREWGEPMGDAVARLERLLLEAGPGARSLVMGAVPGGPLWAMNIGGTVRSLDHGTAGLTQAPRSPGRLRRSPQRRAPGRTP